MSMKVERSSLDQVKARFATNKKKAEEKELKYNFQQKVSDMKEEVRVKYMLQIIIETRLNKQMME